MRIVGLFLVIIAFALTSTTSFAQPSRDGYASETSEIIAKSLKDYQAIFGPPGGRAAVLNALCAPLAQPLRAECEMKVDEVTKLFRNTEVLLDGQPKRVDSLPDVYKQQYRRGAMANMSVTDQINWARFQYAYIAFLTWYVGCYPLPAIDNIPLTVPPGPVGELTSKPSSAPQTSPLKPGS